MAAVTIQFGPLPRSCMSFRWMFEGGESGMDRLFPLPAEPRTQLSHLEKKK